MTAAFRRLPGTVLALLVLILVLATSVGETVYEKQQQLRGLNGQIIATKTRLKTLIDQEQAIKRQIAALDFQLAQVAEKIAQETALLEELRIKVEAAKEVLFLKEAELKQHIEDFSKRMRLMYKSGKVNGLELVFSAVNFSDLLSRIFFYMDIIRDDRRQKDLLQQERLAIEVIKADLDAKHAQQAQVVQSIKDQKAKLEAVRAERSDAEQRVRAVEGEVKRELDAMEAQRAVLQAQLNRLLAESLRARSTGKWIWPMDGVITQGFGCSPYVFEPYEPSCASKHFHSGVDIATDYGTPVHAADGGIVHNFSMGCSWNTNLLCGYGRYVLVIHAGGFTSLYGHLSGWAQPDGIDIPKDAVIGYEGSSGASTGAHLHFEIAVGGIPVDPMAYLP
jgi:murein DD-endopeptidase MepM/ murein hydrolase activator NlpD